MFDKIWRVTCGEVGAQLVLLIPTSKRAIEVQTIGGNKLMDIEICSMKYTRSQIVIADNSGSLYEFAARA